MKLIMLGTGNAVPSEERFCSCALLETGGAYYVFDAGAPLAELLPRYGIDCGAVRAVFVTHPHADHIAGLAHFVCLCTWKFKDVSADILLPSPEAVGAATALACGGPYEHYDPERLRIMVYDDGEIYRDEHITVTAYTSAHMPRAHSLWIEAEGKNALITGDLDPAYTSLCPRAFTDRTAFTLICSAHQSEETVRATFPRIKTDRLLVTHIGARVPEEDFARISRDIPLTIVRDGDRFEF